MKIGEFEGGLWNNNNNFRPNNELLIINSPSSSFSLSSSSSSSILQSFTCPRWVKVNQHMWGFSCSFPFVLLMLTTTRAQAFMCSIRSLLHQVTSQPDVWLVSPLGISTSVSASICTNNANGHFNSLSCISLFATSFPPPPPLGLIATSFSMALLAR